jgi:hypothetical protein
MFESKHPDQGEPRDPGPALGERLRSERKEEHRPEGTALWEGYDADILGALDP